MPVILELRAACRPLWAPAAWTRAAAAARGLGRRGPGRRDGDGAGGAEAAGVVSGTSSRSRRTAAGGELDRSFASTPGHPDADGSPFIQGQCPISPASRGSSAGSKPAPDATGFGHGPTQPVSGEETGGAKPKSGSTKYIKYKAISCETTRVQSCVTG